MARSLAVSRGVEAERQALPIEVAGIASAGVLTRDFPKRRTRDHQRQQGRLTPENIGTDGRYRSIRSIISEYFPHRGPRDRSYRVIAQTCIHFEQLVL